jgi:single-stranded DNA-binding protein
MLAFALAGTSKIEAYGTQAEFAHGSFHDGNDLVVHGSTMLRVWVTQHDGCREFVLRFRDIGKAFQFSRRAAQKELASRGREFVYL